MDSKRLKKGRKRGNQKILSSTLISHQHQQIIQRDTVHQFGQTWGYAASDIRILDNQFSNIRFQTENLVTKILNGYEAAVARDDGLLTVEDAAMLISYAELEMDEPTFRKSCSRSLYSSSPSSSPSIAPASSFPAGRPSSPEHQLAESLISGIIQPHLLSTTHSPKPCSPHALLSLERWISFIKAFIRLKHMQDLLLQRKGIIPPASFSATASASAAGTLSPGRHFASSSSLASGRMGNLYSQRSQSSNDLLPKDQQLQQTSASTLFPSLLDDISSAMVPNPTDSSRLRTHSQPSDSSATALSSSSTRLAPLRLKRQKRHEAKAAFLQKSGFDSGFGRETPRCLRPGEDSNGGGGGRAVGELSKDDAKWEMIRELKRELQLSQEGLAQIDNAMAENITWVHNNCQPTGTGTGTGSALSKRAAKHCQRISAERFLEIFDSLRLVSLRRALEKMRFAVKLTGIAVLSKDYSRAKAIEILSHVTHTALRRQYEKLFKPWLQRVKWERRWEQEAASVEMSRVARGFVCRRRLFHQRRESSALVLQCGVRVWLSKKHVQQLREKRRVTEARVVLVRWFRGLVAVSRAKAEAQERREERAARKIQRVQRGIRGRQRVQAMRKQQQLLQQSAVKIQCFYRSKIHAVAVVRRRREELRQQQRDQEEQQRQREEQEREQQERLESAVLSLQCFGRRLIARRVVARRRVERERQRMAIKIQRFVRRILVTKLYRDRLRDMKRERNKQLKQLQQQQQRGQGHEAAASTPASSRPSSSSSTASASASVSAALHTAAVRLQSLYRGGVVRETVQTLREDKKKNASRLFSHSRHTEPSPSPSPSASAAPHTPGKQSQSRFGFRSKPEAEEKDKEKEKPKTPASASPSPSASSSSFFGSLLRSSSRDQHEEQQHPPHAQPQDLPQEEPESHQPAEETGAEAEAHGPPPGGGVHRMLSIVKSVSREDDDSPLLSPTLPQSPPQLDGDKHEGKDQEEEKEETEERQEPQPEAEGVAAVEGEEPEPDEEVQAINSSVPSPSPVPVSSQTSEAAASSSRPPSRDTSVLAAMGKKLFRTNSELAASPSVPASASASSPQLSKSPSFFRSLSRPASRSSADPQKPEERGKSPSLLRSLSQSFGLLVGHGASTSGGAGAGAGTESKAPSHRSTPAPPPEPQGPEAAAAVIQRAVRVRQARRKTEERRERVREMQREAGAWSLWAVSNMQRIVRGKLARQRIKRILRDKQEEEKRKEKERKERKRAEREAKIREEDEAEVQTLLKYQSYGKPQPQTKPNAQQLPQTVGTEAEAEERAVSAEKKKKKKKKTTKTQDDSRSASPASLSGSLSESAPAAVAVSDSASASESVSGESAGLMEQMKRLEDLEKTMREREAQMLEATRHAEEKSAAIERALELMERRAKEEDFERAQRKRFLDMAAGSPYGSLGGPLGSSRSAMGTGMGMGMRMGSSRLNSSRAPPSARSARDGTPRPKDTLKIIVHGVEWVQLWDAVETSWYWYCEASGAAQWEQPTESDWARGGGGAGGYESGGGLTDYSTDNYESGGESLGGDGEGGEGGAWYGPWQEFWDESAQAKYWYNNETGEASWTAPEDLSVTGAGAGEGMGAGGVGEWVSYIDDNTGQEYWYNPTTGETSWG